MAHSSTLCGHLVFVNGGGIMMTCFYYAQNDLVFNTKTRVWQTLDVAINLRDHSTTLVGDKLFVIGGKLALPKLDHRI